jgi:hypothetical protein
VIATVLSRQRMGAIHPKLMTQTHTFSLMRALNGIIFQVKYKVNIGKKTQHRRVEDFLQAVPKSVAHQVQNT